jgi:hypothetical protein
MASCFHKTAPSFQDARSTSRKRSPFPNRGGSCVAAMFYESETLQTKIFACETNLFLACEGSVKSLNVPESAQHQPIGNSVRLFFIFHCDNRLCFPEEWCSELVR